jgi:hypothetical protein
MSATNYLLALYQKIFALAEAHAPTAGKLKIANEVREDRGLRNPNPQRAKAPADFPRVVLRDKGVTDSVFNEDATFSTQNDDFDPATDSWSEKITQTYEAKILHDGLNLTNASAFELELMTALRKGGPRLGLPYVTGWTTSSTTTETANDTDGPGLRRVTTLTIAVSMMFEGPELTA